MHAIIDVFGAVVSDARALMSEMVSGSDVLK